MWRKNLKYGMVSMRVGAGIGLPEFSNGCKLMQRHQIAIHKGISMSCHSASSIANIR